MKKRWRQELNKTKILFGVNSFIMKDWDFHIIKASMFLI